MTLHYKKIVTAIFFAALLFTIYGSATADINDPATIRAFENKTNSVVKDIQNNSSYKRIPLDSKKDQDWFTLLAIKLFDKQISKDQFVNEGTSRFPGYKKSFEFLANSYLK